MFKKLLSVGLVAASTVVLAACGSSSSENTLEKIQESGTLTVAVSPDYAPFEFQALVDGKNTVVGADIELAQDIADELGVELKISTMSFNNVLSSLQSGKADIAISGITYTEERAKVYDFSESYYDSANLILVQKAALSNYTAVADLAGKKVGVQTGTTQESDAKAQLTDSTITSLTAMGEMVNELKSGQLDAIILDAPVATGYVAQNDDLVALDFTIETADDGYKAVAMPKGSDELKEVVDKVVAEVKGETFESYIAEASNYTEVSE